MRKKVILVRQKKGEKPSITVETLDLKDPTLQMTIPADDCTLEGIILSKRIRKIPGKGTYALHSNGKAVLISDEDGNDNLLVIDGTGEKSADLLMNNMLQANASYVVASTCDSFLDCFMDNLTKADYDIHVVDMANGGSSYIYNPLRYSSDAGEVETAAETLIKGDDEFVRAQQLLLCAFISCLNEIFPDLKNLQAVCALCDELATGDKLWRIDKLFAALQQDSEPVKYYSYFTAICAWNGFSKENVARACSEKIRLYCRCGFIGDEVGFDLSSLGTGKTMLFIKLPENDPDVLPLAQLMMIQIIEQTYKKQDEQDINISFNNNSPVPIRFVIPDIDALGALPKFDLYLANMNDYGMSIFSGIRSISQIRSLYPETWQIVLGKFAMKCYCGEADEETESYLNYMFCEGDKKKFNKVRQMPDEQCFVSVCGCSPLIDKRYGVDEKHPNAPDAPVDVQKFKSELKTDYDRLSYEQKILLDVIL